MISALLRNYDSKNIIIIKNKIMKYFEHLKNIVNSMISIRLNIKSILRILFVLYGLMYTIKNIKLDLDMYLLRMTKTEMTVETDTATAFPSITICLNSMHSKGKLYKKNDCCL